MQTQGQDHPVVPGGGLRLWKTGRAAMATDPAPSEMFETVVNLKPKGNGVQA